MGIIDETACVYGPSGTLISAEKVSAGFDIVWDIIAEAFKYSNENCADIPPNISLKDFFQEKLNARSIDEEERIHILQLAEMWGAFVGDPWEMQSLKWFWLEECLDGGEESTAHIGTMLIHNRKYICYRYSWPNSSASGKECTEKRRCSSFNQGYKHREQ